MYIKYIVKLLFIIACYVTKNKVIKNKILSISHMSKTPFFSFCSPILNVPLVQLSKV